MDENELRERFGGCDPRELRAAALLMEADAVAAGIQARAEAGVTAHGCLSVLGETAFVVVEGIEPGDHDDDTATLSVEDARRLLDTLRGMGPRGLAHFFARRQEKNHVR